jgi:hypothetical protein
MFGKFESTTGRNEDWNDGNIEGEYVALPIPRDEPVMQTIFPCTRAIALSSHAVSYLSTGYSARWSFEIIYIT